MQKVVEVTHNKYNSWYNEFIGERFVVDGGEHFFTIIKPLTKVSKFNEKLSNFVCFLDCECCKVIRDYDEIILI